jgi:hypothetical protein
MSFPAWRSPFSKNQRLYAKASKLIDNFDDNSLDATKWSWLANTVEQNQRLEISSALSATYYGLTSALWTFRETAVSIQVIDVGNQSLAS